MPYLNVTEAARRDFDRLRDFLAEQNLTAAESLLKTLESELLLLLAQPRIGRPVRKRYYEWKVRFGRGAYLVRYSLHGDEIRLLRIQHSRERRT